MRGKVAKKLKKEIYGDDSVRTRDLVWQGGRGNSKKLEVKTRDGKIIPYGTVVNVGKRQEYKDAKKDLKRRGSEK